MTVSVKVKQVKNKKHLFSGKMPFKHVDVLKTNLLELLSPEKFADADPELHAIADEVFDKGVNDMLAKYMSTSSSSTTTVTAPSPAVGNNIDSTHSVISPETESESLKPSWQPFGTLKVMERDGTWEW